MLLTLGVGVADWIESMLAAPDGRGELVRLTREQRAYLLRHYEVDEAGRRRYRRGVISRGKGWGRSPLAAFLAAVEALGPVRFERFDEHGVPVGRPWCDERRVLVQIAAVSESQTRNCWSVLQDALVDGPAGALPGVTVGATRIDLPDRGRIEFLTSSALSREGARPLFVVLDQTESWTRRNGGVKLAATLRRNLGKVDGSSIETPNSYRPGDGSVSEASFQYAADIAAGIAIDEGLLVDDRHARDGFVLDADTTDAELLDELRFVYGCSARSPHDCGHDDCPSGWVDLERIVREVRDLDTAPEDAQQFYLNRPTSPPGSYISAAELDAATIDTSESAQVSA